MTTERAPETAYDLLERVAQHIEEEPRRYDQSMWAMLGKDFIAAKRGADAVPVCGTVCCRAGWIVALHDGLESEPLRAASVALATSTWNGGVPARAMQILDMDNDACRSEPSMHGRERGTNNGSGGGTCASGTPYGDS